MLKECQEAPDFALTDSEGRVVKLSDFRGSNVVLYFYPKDMTPGCTRQACGFRDYHGYYRDKNAVILGVSMDSDGSHRKFSEKYALPFRLLSDFDGRVARLYGAHERKIDSGGMFWRIKRITFFIDKSGVIAKIWDKVNADSHHRDVLEFLEKTKKLA